jgi:hypothetical protein
MTIPRKKNHHCCYGYRISATCIHKVSQVNLETVTVSYGEAEELF